MGIQDCQIVQLPRITDARGNLTFIEGTRHIPFKIERVYYIYDIPGGSDRAAHAHKALYEFVIAMSGSFDVEIDDGERKLKYHLNRSYYGLLITPMVWRKLDNFSSGSVCTVMASAPYDESDYHRDYTEFLREVKASAKGSVP